MRTLFQGKPILLTEDGYEFVEGYSGEDFHNKGFVRLFSEACSHETLVNDPNFWIEVSQEDMSRLRSRYEKQLALAKDIATKAHKGQVDKGGREYIHHPETVSKNCIHLEAKIVAYLHDVLEDTPVTAEDLISTGIDADLVDAVQKLTKDEHYVEEIYFSVIKKDPVAREVKLQDLTHNMDRSRNPKLPPKQLEEMYARYEREYEYLFRE